MPTVVVRQQAFASLQGLPEGTRELRVPAEWQVAASSTVSLTIGAGMVPALARKLLCQAFEVMLV